MNLATSCKWNHIIFVLCLAYCTKHNVFKVHPCCSVQFSRSVMSDSATPWIAARQACLSITNSRSPPKPTSIESGMPSNHLILCCPLLLLPSISPSIRVFSNESALCIRWPKYWSFSYIYQHFIFLWMNFCFLNNHQSSTLLFILLFLSTLTLSCSLLIDCFLTFKPMYWWFIGNNNPFSFSSNLSCFIGLFSLFFLNKLLFLDYLLSLPKQKLWR